MADFSSSFAPNPCSYLANSGGTNITLANECRQCGCGCRPGCDRAPKCCGGKRRGRRHRR